MTKKGEIAEKREYRSRDNPKHGPGKKRALTKRWMRLEEHPHKPVPRGGRRSRRRLRVATWVPR